MDYIMKWILEHPSNTCWGIMIDNDPSIKNNSITSNHVILDDNWQLSLYHETRTWIMQVQSKQFSLSFGFIFQALILLDV